MTTQFTDIIPVLVYADIRAAHDFLVGALGFTSAGLHEEPSGQVVHGEVQAGGRRIWLHRVSDEHGLDTPQSIGRAAGGMVVHVDDVDAHCEQRSRRRRRHHLGAPGPGLRPSASTPCATPRGTAWWIATPTAA